MRRVQIILLFILLYTSGFSQFSSFTFITEWYTGHPGSSSPTSITIPVDPNYTYNYDIDWDGDGIADDIGVTGEITHDYGVVDTVRIGVKGQFPRLYFNGGGDVEKLIKVNSVGGHQWKDLTYAFSGTTNLTSINGNLDLEGITDLTGMFANSGIKSISSSVLWDVSNILSFSEMFMNANNFITNISLWNVSKGEDMSRMFSGATSFRSDISEWNTISVLDMTDMFKNAVSFNCYIGLWEVNSVLKMDGVLNGASSFSTPLGNWNLNENVSLKNAFDGTNLSISDYDKTLIKFSRQNIQNLNLGANGLKFCIADSIRSILINEQGWTIDDDGMDCTQLLSLDDFVLSWKHTHHSATSLTIEIPTHPNETYNYDIDWDNDGIFDELGLAGNVSHTYDTAAIQTIRIRGLFPHLYFSNINEAKYLYSIEQWGDIPWKTMWRAFEGAENMHYNAVDQPNLSEVNDMRAMFALCRRMDGDLNLWDVSQVTDMSKLFHGANLFNGDISNWDVVNVEDMELMFADAHRFNSDISNWDVSKVRSMKNLFFRAVSFNVDIGNWDVALVDDMTGMFLGAKIFNQNIGNWDVSEVRKMGEMFMDTDAFNIDISGWDVSKVAFMNDMFSNAQSFNIDIGDWDVSAVSKMQEMFRNAVVFDQDIGNWDVANVNDMFRMFLGASSFNQDISNWDTGEVNDMSIMFNSATSFDQNLGNWKLNANVKLNNMLDRSGMSVSNYDNTLIGWNNQAVNNVILGAEDLKYCNSILQRDSLIQVYNWTIENDTLDCTIISSINEINDDFDVDIYPNPSSGDFNIHINNSNQTDYLLKLYNSEGKEIWKSDLISLPLYNQRLSSMSEGLYYLVVSSGHHVTSKKIMIAK